MNWFSRLLGSGKHRPKTVRPGPQQGTQAATPPKPTIEPYIVVGQSHLLPALLKVTSRQVGAVGQGLITDAQMVAYQQLFERIVLRDTATLWDRVLRGVLPDSGILPAYWNLSDSQQHVLVAGTAAAILEFHRDNHAQGAMSDCLVGFLYVAAQVPARTLVGSMYAQYRQRDSTDLAAYRKDAGPDLAQRVLGAVFGEVPDRRLPKEFGFGLCGLEEASRALLTLPAQPKQQLRIAAVLPVSIAGIAVPIALAASPVLCPTCVNLIYEGEAVCAECGGRRP